MSHIALAGLSITIVSEERTDLRCFLFHDAEDGYDFGRAVGARVIGLFCDTYSSSPGFGSSAVISTAPFAPFSARLLEIISGTDRDVLCELRSCPGVLNALLVFNEDGRTVSAAPVEGGEIGLVANLRSLLTFSDEITLSREDRTVAVRLEMSRHRVFVRKLSQASLVVICSKSKDPALSNPRIRATAIILEKRESPLSFPPHPNPRSLTRHQHSSHVPLCHQRNLK